MARPKVMAEVVNPGQCRYYKQGRQFLLGGFTPAGLCDSAYTVLARDARVMRYGGTLPWETDGKVLTHCPDPDGALWQLRCVEESEGRPIRQPEAAVRHPARDTASKNAPLTLYVVNPCRGFRGECPHSLVTSGDLVEHLVTAVEGSAWIKTRLLTAKTPIPPHQRLTLALAGCPNACSRPQITDIGMVARVSPTEVTDACNHCGICADNCREQAIICDAGRTELKRPRCVGCGLCVKKCPRYALTSPGLEFRVLAGGKLGRHPVLAQEIAQVKAPAVANVVRGILDCLDRYRPAAEKVADALADIGLTALRERSLCYGEK